MIKITKTQYNNIPRDYRSTWSNPDYPEYIGKKTAFEGSVYGLVGKTSNCPTALIIEGYHFQILEN